VITFINENCIDAQAELPKICWCKKKNEKKQFKKTKNINKENTRR
jgi:hypothetical protein